MRRASRISRSSSLLLFSQSTMLVPDFSHQKNITSRFGDYEGSYTIPTDGFINVNITYQNSSNSPVLKINGVRIWMDGGIDTTRYRYIGNHGALIPVKKGDIVSYTSASSSYATDRFSIVF